MGVWKVDSGAKMTHELLRSYGVEAKGGELFSLRMNINRSSTDIAR